MLSNSHENVFVYSCGTGFHQQLMADASLCLSFSATAMHYVSEKPCEIEDHVHMVGATPEERAKFARRQLLTEHPVERQSWPQEAALSA